MHLHYLQLCTTICIFLYIYEYKGIGTCSRTTSLHLFMSVYAGRAFPARHSRIRYAFAWRHLLVNLLISTISSNVKSNNVKSIHNNHNKSANKRHCSHVGTCSISTFLDPNYCFSWFLYFWKKLFVVGMDGLACPIPPIHFSLTEFVHSL